MNKTPDFLIGGVARSATTWLCRALDTHQQVYLPKPFTPEPKFFSRDKEYAKGMDYYCQKWFATAQDGLLRGEKSTSYLETSGCAERIHTHLPNVKLIFLLRDPVERAFSNYLWSKQNGLESETFETALELEQKREASLPENLREARPYAYFARGLYAQLLEPFFNFFPHERVLCLKMEDIGRDPNAFMQRLFVFLGLPPCGTDYSTLGIVNATPEELRKEAMSQTVRQHLYKAYEQPHQTLLALLGAGFTVW